MKKKMSGNAYVGPNAVTSVNGQSYCYDANGNLVKTVIEKLSTQVLRNQKRSQWEKTKHFSHTIHSMV